MTELLHVINSFQKLDEETEEAIKKYVIKSILFNLVLFVVFL